MKPTPALIVWDDATLRVYQNEIDKIDDPARLVRLIDDLRHEQAPGLLITYAEARSSILAQNTGPRQSAAPQPSVDAAQVWGLAKPLFLLVLLGGAGVLAVVAIIATAKAVLLFVTENATVIALVVLAIAALALLVGALRGGRAESARPASPQQNSINIIVNQATGQVEVRQ